MALTKAEIAEALFNQLGLNKREARELVDLFFEEVRGALSRGEQVKLSGFGNFDEAAAQQAIVMSDDEIVAEPRRVVGGMGVDRQHDPGQRDRPSAGCPGIHGHLVLTALSFGLLLGESAPGDFGIGEDHLGFEARIQWLGFVPPPAALAISDCAQGVCAAGTIISP